MGGENSGVSEVARRYFRCVKALRSNALFATLLGILVLPGFMARAFPHECHAAVRNEHGHDSVWLIEDCALCDLAMPIAETPSCPAAVLLQHQHSIQRNEALPVIARTSLEGSDTRGPPQA